MSPDPEPLKHIANRDSQTFCPALERPAQQKFQDLRCLPAELGRACQYLRLHPTQVHSQPEQLARVPLQRGRYRHLGM